MMRDWIAVFLLFVAAVLYPLIASPFCGPLFTGDPSTIGSPDPNIVDGDWNCADGLIFAYSFEHRTSVTGSELGCGFGGCSDLGGSTTITRNNGWSWAGTSNDPDGCGSGEQTEDEYAEITTNFTWPSEGTLWFDFYCFNCGSPGNTCPLIEFYADTNNRIWVYVVGGEPWINWCYAGTTRVFYPSFTYTNYNWYRIKFQWKVSTSEQKITVYGLNENLSPMLVNEVASEDSFSTTIAVPSTFTRLRFGRDTNCSSAEMHLDRVMLFNTSDL